MLTVVIPVHNEVRTVRAAVERLLKADLPVALEVIVVDDGSIDGSADEVSTLVDDRTVRLLRHERNRGKGAAVRTGIAAATGDWITVYDADLEYNPQDFRAMLEPLLSGEVQVVYGARTFGGHSVYSFWYVLGNRFLTFAASFLFNTWLSDIQTCFKMTSAETWRSLQLRSNSFAIDPETTAKLLRSGERIYEVPVSYRARSRAEGKQLKWTDGIVALWVLVRVRFLGR